MIKQIGNLPENSILVTTDVVGLYPSIPHEFGLKALEEALETRESKQISADDLIKLAKFVLQNNYFEFNEEVNNRFQEWLSELSLHHHMHTSSWIRLNLNF